MTAFRKLITIKQTKAEIWKIISALDLLHHFHPDVSQSYYRPPFKTGVGSSRVGHLIPYGKIEEQVTYWKQEQGLSFKVMFSKNTCLKYVYSYIELFETGICNTQVSLTIKYKVKYGLMGYIWDTVLFQSSIDTYTSNLLKGLKSFAEIDPSKRKSTLNVLS